MADKKAVKSFLWGTLTGAVTGAVTALLFAPKPGNELRKDISVTAHKVGEKTADLGRQAGSAVQAIAKRTSNLVRTRKAGVEEELVVAVSALPSDNEENESR
jgi:gas vesicle protein